MSILSVRSLIPGKFSFGGGLVKRIALCCAYVDFSVSVCLSVCLVVFCSDILLCQLRGKGIHRSAREHKQMHEV